MKQPDLPARPTWKRNIGGIPHATGWRDSAGEIVVVMNWYPLVQRARAERAALVASDGLARILAAHEAYERGCQDVEQVEKWATRAGEEIEVAG